MAESAQAVEVAAFTPAVDQTSGPSSSPAHLPERALLGREIEPLVDAAGLAVLLGVTRSYVYDHADELGAIRLGSGPRARLRFRPSAALAALGGSDTRNHHMDPESPVAAERLAPRRRRASGSSARLLPVRGLDDEREAA